jgi:predicted phosphoribosyltransferase/dienelactone hydrolase
VNIHEIFETMPLDEDDAMSETEEIRIGDLGLAALLTVPDDARGLIVFAHGSGSSRHSARNTHAAHRFQQLGFATLLFDLLTEDEARERRNVFDIPLLAGRVGLAIDWAQTQPRLSALPLGLFGASTGGGAALAAAAASRHVRAVVSRGGRPDLAGEALPHVTAPTLFVVGGNDHDVLKLNEEAASRMTCERRLIVIPGAGHLFEEPGTLDHVLAVTSAWLLKHLSPSEPVSLPFTSREQAGLVLARVLAGRTFANPVVYALPRGGVPVAKPVADALGAPLDLLMVRKIGVPSQPELAAASVVDGEQFDIVHNERVMRATGMDERQVAQLAKAELKEIERRRLIYLPDRKPVPAEGRSAILVDDGIATGASMRAAILAVRRRKPAEIIIAVPVAGQVTLKALGAIVDDAIVLAAPDGFDSVGRYYLDFHQLSDDEVVAILAPSESRETGPARGKS